MLGSVARKDKAFYVGKWINSEDITQSAYFKFSIQKDDNSIKTDFENLSGIEGGFIIGTKSTLPFAPEDIVMFRGQKYFIENVDGNRKTNSEPAFAIFKQNGNIVTTLTLRKAG